MFSCCLEWQLFLKPFHAFENAGMFGTDEQEIFSSGFMTIYVGSVTYASY